MIVEWNDHALASVERQLKMSQSARGDTHTKLTPRLWEWSIPTAIAKAACLLPPYNINLEDFEDYDQKK